MRQPNSQLLLVICISTLISFNSCSKVTWAAFTTPKDNFENVPKVLEQWLGSPATKKIRIFEYDKDKYMGLFVFKNSGISQKIDSTKANRINIILPTEAKVPIETNQLVIGNNVNGYEFFLYTPSASEDEIVTAFYLMEAVNKMKKNRNIEVYSQTHPNVVRQFFIIKK